MDIEPYPTVLLDCEAEDSFADLDSLNQHIQAKLERNGGGGGERNLLPAEFVKDLDALLGKWYGPIVDAR